MTTDERKRKEAGQHIRRAASELASAASQREWRDAQMFVNQAAEWLRRAGIELERVEG